MCRPFLFIDVDGVLSLFGFDTAHPPEGRFLMVDGIVHLLSRPAASLLAGLRPDFELIWCTGWEEKADEYLPHALGLPAGLPHLHFDRAAPADGRHWKLAAIEAEAGTERPLAWIDDDHDETCRRWAMDRPAPTRLVSTDPAVGLTAEQADGLRDWVRSLGHQPAPQEPDS
jgi:hypothetical protein